MQPPPIIVLGPHRSGTSAVTRLINLMGAEVGAPEALVGANIENPKGFWERHDLIAANDAVLASSGAAWDVVAGWDAERVSAPAKEAFHASLNNILAKFPAGKPIVLKDPRLCLTLPLLLELLPDAVCVFVFRPPEEVAVSLEKRNAIPLPAGVALWEAYAIHALNAARGRKNIFLTYHDVVQAPWRETSRLFAELQARGMVGLSAPEENAVLGFVDGSLMRSKPRELPLPVEPGLLAAARGEQAVAEKLTLPVASAALLEVYGRMAAPLAALKEQAAQLSGALHVSDTSEETRATAMLAQAAHMQQLIAERDGQIAGLLKELHKLRERQAHASEQLTTLTRLLAETEASRSWQLGQAVMNLFALMTRRGKSANALRQARSVVQDMVDPTRDGSSKT